MRVILAITTAFFAIIPGCLAQATGPASQETAAAPKIPTCAVSIAVHCSILFSLGFLN